MASTPYFDLPGRSVAVTGGRGFLGGYVCDALRARGAEVHALDSAAYDLTEQSDVRRLYRELRPSVVVHAAAACGGIAANVANPGRFLYANAAMGLALLEEGRVAGLDKFVLVSTTCAYPQDASLPLREDTMWDGPPTGATGPYGAAKRLLHEACATYERQYGMRSAVVVPANLYGPRDHFDEAKSHVVPALIRRYVEAKSVGAPSVTNWGTGRPTREFLHVADAAEAIVLAAERDVSPEPINVGTGVETSIAELTAVVAAAVGYSGELEWDTTKPDGQPRRYLDVTRARERLGFKARIKLADGIAETVNWYSDHSSDAAIGARAS